MKSSHVPMTAWSSSPLPFRDNLQALLIVIGVKEPRSAPDLGPRTQPGTHWDFVSALGRGLVRMKIKRWSGTRTGTQPGPLLGSTEFRDSMAHLALTSRHGHGQTHPMPWAVSAALNWPQESHLMTTSAGHMSRSHCTPHRLGPTPRAQ